MLRIEAELLQQQGELFYYQDVLFTGIAFFLNGPLVEKVNEYHKGELIGPYISKWLDNNTDILRIDLNELDGDGEHQQAYLNEQAFTGIGYNISVGICHGESEFTNGWEGQTISFFGDGVLGSIELMNDTLAEEVIFDRQGFVKEYQLNKFKVFNVKFGYIEHRLSTVEIKGDFFNEVNKNEYLLNIEVLDTLNEVKKVQLDSTLKLFSSGVDDKFIEAIMLNEELKNTNDIIISNTSLTLNSFVKIINNTKLIRLWIDDSRVDMKTNLPPILQELKINNPICEIRLNNEKIL